jgi:WD40 repeat protein
MTKRWADVPTEYLAYYVPAVLAPDRRYARIRELVTSAGYLAEKLSRVGIRAVLDDMRTVRGLAPTPTDAADLTPVETALNEAAQLLQHAPEQLCGQLLARIPRPATGDVARLLDEAAAWREATWWKPSGTIHNHGYLASFGPVQGFVDAIAISDDGSVLLAGDRNGRLYAWDLRTRDQLWEAPAGAAVNAVAFRPDSFEAFVALEDGSVARWTPADQRLRIHDRLGHAVTSLTVDATMVVYGGGPAIHGTPVAGDGPTWRVSAGQDLVTAVAITGDGERCVSGARDGSLVLWRLADGNQLRRLPPPVDRVLCLAAVPGTGEVVVGAKNKQVVVVDVDTGVARVAGRHTNQVRSVAALNAGSVVSGSYDGHVVLWDLVAGTNRRIGRHNGWCLAVAAPRGGGPVATGSEDGRLRVWDPGTSPPETITAKQVRSLAVAGPIAYGGTDRLVCRIDVGTGATLPPLGGHRRPVEALVGTVTGVASGSADRTIRLWSPATGVGKALRGHTGGVGALAVTPDGTEIVSVSRDGTWRRWDARTGMAGPVSENTQPYNDVLALSPDGGLVITATIEHIIEVWDRVSGQRTLPPLAGHTGYVEALSVTSDGTLLVSGSWDRTLRFWDLATGEPRWTMPCDEWVVDAAVTKDGRLAAAYCANGTVVVVNVAALAVEKILDLGGSAYGRLALSRDDRTLFALRGYELQAWDIATNALLAKFDADIPLRRLAVADTDRVVVGTGIGTLISMHLKRA